MPATILIALCAYAYIVLHDIEKAPAKRPRDERQGHRRSQFTWHFEYTGKDGKKFTDHAALRPRGPLGALQRGQRGRPARLLGPGLADEDRRRPRASPPTTGSRRSRPATRSPTRSSAPSSAASATPSCARPRTSCPQQAFDAWFAKQSNAGAAARRRRRRGGGAAAGGANVAAGKQVFASNGCAACHTLADAGAIGHGRPGPRQGAGHARTKLHQAVDRRPERRDRQGLPEGDHARDVQDADQAARPGRARQVPVHRDSASGSPWSPPSASPTLPAPVLFLVLGAAFCVRPELARSGCCYGHDTYAHFIDDNSILLIGLLAAPLFFLVGLGAFDYWFYWAAGRPTRPEDHSRPRRALVEGLLPGQHRPQGHRDPVHGPLVRVPVHRRPDRDADARRARAAGPPVRRRRTRSTACSASTRRC